MSNFLVLKTHYTLHLTYILFQESIYQLQANYTLNDQNSFANKLFLDAVRLLYVCGSCKSVASLLQVGSESVLRLKEFMHLIRHWSEISTPAWEPSVSPVRAGLGLYLWTLTSSQLL